MSTDYRAERTENIRALSELIKGIKVAMLTSVDTDGKLHSQPVLTQQADFDGDLWFFIHAGLLEGHEPEQQVNVTYAAPERNLHISMSGTAHRVQDVEKIEERWQSEFKDWFPKGLDDPELALLQVVVEHSEYWQLDSGGVAGVFQSIKDIATRQKRESKETKKLDLNP